MDDIPPIQGELYAGVVLSQHAHANITVDTSAALEMDGVIDYVCVDDVPGDNMIGVHWINSGTSLIQTPLGQTKVPLLESCP